MNTYLVITCIADYDAGIGNSICDMASKLDCSILQCDMSALGQEYGIMAMLSGPWNAIAKLETQLAQLGKKHGIPMQLKRTQPKTYQQNFIPYNVAIIALDSPGVIFRINKFFNEKSIYINELSTYSYVTHQTQTQLFSLNMTVLISTDSHIPELREEFIELCDELNLDAIMEPEKS